MSGAAVLALTLVAVSPPCPPGSALKRRATAEAREEVCERPDGMRQGPRRAFYTDDRPWFEGSYEEGKRTGEWRFWFPDGSPMATISYRADKTDGPLTRFSAGHVKEIEGSCKAGLEEGVWTRYWPNGAPQLMATFKGGKPDPALRFFAKRGGPIDRDAWLNEKVPGATPGSARYTKALNDNRPEALFTECRN